MLTADRDADAARGQAEDLAGHHEVRHLRLGLEALPVLRGDVRDHVLRIGDRRAGRRRHRGAEDVEELARARTGADGSRLQGIVRRREAAGPAESRQAGPQRRHRERAAEGAVVLAVDGIDVTRGVAPVVAAEELAFETTDEAQSHPPGTAWSSDPCGSCTSSTGSPGRLQVMPRMRLPAATVTSSQNGTT